MKAQTKQNLTVATVLIVTLIAFAVVDYVVRYSVSGKGAIDLKSAQEIADSLITIHTEAMFADFDSCYQHSLKLQEDNLKFREGIRVFTQVVDSLEFVATAQKEMIQSLKDIQQAELGVIRADSSAKHRVLEAELTRMEQLFEACEGENKVLRIALDQFQINIREEQEKIENNK